MPAAAIVGSAVLGASESRKNRKAAKGAQNQADSLGREQLGLAKEEFAYKKKLVDDMLGDANLSEADYAKGIGEASTAVRDSFSKSAEMEKRSLGRYGINPASGKFKSLNKRNALNLAVAEANAINTTRRSLKDYERGATSEARSAGLGLRNPAINVLGENSNRAQDNANNYNSAASSSLAAGLNTAGTIYGMTRTPASITPTPQPVAPRTVAPRTVMA